MDWLRVYHGMPHDPKLRLAARRAGDGVTPGHVVAVWMAMLDHASRSTPRGSIDTFDTEATAEGFGWSDEVVAAAFEGLAKVGCHDRIKLTRWETRQQKRDPTGAKRQKTFRDKSKQETSESGQIDPNINDSNALRNASNGEGITDSNALRNTEEREERESLFERPSLQETDTVTSNVPLHTARAAEIWSALSEAGASTNPLTRHWHARPVAEWLRDGLTTDQLRDALTRAMEARKRQRSDQPLNVGFVDGFVRDVLAGKPDRGSSNGNQAGDELSARFAGAAR